MKLNINQWLLVVGSIVVVAVVVSVIITKFVHQRPEVELCREFLEQHSAVLSSLGQFETITYKKHAASRVSFKRGRIEGFYSFNALGDTGEVTVRVFWQNAESGKGFRVDRVERLDKGEASTLLWSATED